MRVVYTPGVWDLLHIGHVNFLEKAATYGDSLVVGVPSDEVVKLDKGREPIIPFEQRLLMVRSLRCVSMAIGYETLDFLPHLKMLLPDVLATGAEWGLEDRHQAAERFMNLRDGVVCCIQRTKGVSTSHIIRRIKEQL